MTNENVAIFSAPTDSKIGEQRILSTVVPRCQYGVTMSFWEYDAKTWGRLNSLNVINATSSKIGSTERLLINVNFNWWN